MCWVAGGEVSWAVQRAASEVSRERQRGVWAWQRRRGGGQDQTFPVACTTTAILARQWQILQPPAPYYPRVIHVVMKSGGAPGGDFPSLKQSLDPSLICVLTQQGCGIQFTPELHSSSRVQAHSEPKRRTHRGKGVPCHVEEAHENTQMSLGSILCDEYKCLFKKTRWFSQTHF